MGRSGDLPGVVARLVDPQRRPRVTLLSPARPGRPAKLNDTFFAGQRGGALMRDKVLRLTAGINRKKLSDRMLGAMIIRVHAWALIRSSN
jgi:hypothetical protein